MINKIINEWTYQLDSGYPTKESDYEVLRTVLQETNMLSEQEIDQTILLAKGLHEQSPEPTNTQLLSEEDLRSRLSDIKIPNDLINIIITIYSGLSDTEKQEFSKNFRIHSIESFIQQGYIPFRKFYNVIPGGAASGMGRGEMMTLLAVKDSGPGGTERHDIVMPNGEWEVKELEKKAFRPAKKGMAFAFDFAPKIIKFYNDIIVPFSNIGDPGDELIPMVDDRSKPLVKKLIDILESRFESVADMNKIKSANEWKLMLFHNWYEGFKELNQLFYQTKFDSDVKDTRLVVKTGGKEKAYWISDTDADNIELKSGEADPANINVGDAIDNVNQNIQIWFKRIEFNEFIKNPRIFIEELNTVKHTFFEGVLGVIYYLKEAKDQKPYLSNPSDFLIYQISQGQYRFRLTNHSANNKPYQLDQN